MRLSNQNTLFNINYGIPTNSGNLQVVNYTFRLYQNFKEIDLIS